MLKSPSNPEPKSCQGKAKEYVQDDLFSNDKLLHMQSVSWNFDCNAENLHEHTQLLFKLAN